MTERLPSRRASSLSESSLSQLRVLAYEFVRLHRPGELPAFTPVWDRAQDASLQLCWTTGDVSAPAGRFADGLPFAARSDEVLLSVFVSYAALLVAHRLRAQLDVGKSDSVKDEFAAVVKSLGGDQALAAELARQMGPALMAVVSRERQGDEDTAASAPPESATRRSETCSDLWLVNVLTATMIKDNKTRPYCVAPCTLEAIRGERTWHKEHFKLYVDESYDEGILLPGSRGKSPQCKPWPRFVGQRGMLLFFVLDSLRDPKRFSLSHRDILVAAGLGGQKRADPESISRGIKKGLNRELDGLLDKLITASGKRGYQLCPSIPYVWIRPAVALSRLQSERPSP